MQQNQTFQFSFYYKNAAIIKNVVAQLEKNSSPTTKCTVTILE
jgi:hypothetical protein